ncbi:MAG: EscN/YscN/HrcN family type III secretion system ATPase, partial [Acidobacteriota bacterium]
MLAAYRQKLEKIDSLKSTGRVTRAVGLIIESQGPAVSVGDLCYLPTAIGERTTMLEVVGFRDNHVLLMPLGAMPPVRAGDRIVAAGVSSEIGVGNGLLGRTIDALGRPLDGYGEINTEISYPLNRMTTNPLQRSNIDEAMERGVRVIDGMLTIGSG